MRDIVFPAEVVIHIQRHRNLNIADAEVLCAVNDRSDSKKQNY